MLAGKLEYRRRTIGSIFLLFLALYLTALLSDHRLVAGILSAPLSFLGGYLFSILVPLVPAPR